MVSKSKEATRRTSTRATLAFHWSYIILPLILLLLSIILTAYFYHRLPVEIAYHFQPDGSPDRWLSRDTIILWMLSAQLFLTLVAGAITWAITKLSAFFRQTENTRLKPEKILLLMGNMVALPQIILGFAILDIFSYNSSQRHIMPLWLFTLIILGVGGTILGIFFIRAIRQVWGANR
ncbi:MAG: DUF1648 domain-containing protein [Chloroflexi bacterium]|nr:DUF1648 domain-containing protein [Chloroflexota bacterium]